MGRKNSQSRAFRDLTGQRFGFLVVLRLSGKSKHGRLLWLCQCDCGNKTITIGNNLCRGNTRSCGCFKNISTVKRLLRHGMASIKNRHPLYITWTNMKRRCNPVSGKSFKHYAGRGIKVCKEWEDFVVFKEWAYKNGYNEDLEIDRIDSNGNYEPSNCRWVTRTQNQRNKRNNCRIAINGITKTLVEWSNESKISARTIASRIKLGWNHNDLLGPVNKGMKYAKKVV